MEALSEGLVSRFSVFSRLRKVRHHGFCCGILRFFLPCLLQWKVSLVFNTPPDPSSVTLVLICTLLCARDVSEGFSPKRQRLGVAREKPTKSITKQTFLHKTRKR